MRSGVDQQPGPVWQHRAPDFQHTVGHHHHVGSDRAGVSTGSRRGPDAAVAEIHGSARRPQGGVPSHGPAGYPWGITARRPTRRRTSTSGAWRRPSRSTETRCRSLPGTTCAGSTATRNWMQTSGFSWYRLGYGSGWPCCCAFSAPGRCNGRLVLIWDRMDSIFSAFSPAL